MNEQAPAYSFKNPTLLTRVVLALLAFQVVLGVVAVVSGTKEHQLLQDFKNTVYSDEDQIDTLADQNDSRQAAIGMTQLGLFTVSVITILFWIYRSNSNAHALGAQNMRFSAGWAVGWYFIPFMNMVRPYQAMQELVKASKNPEGWQQLRASAAVKLWWAIFLVDTVLGSIAFKLASKAQELDEFISANSVMVVSDCASIVLAIVLVPIVRTVCAGQMLHSTAQGMTLSTKA